MSDKLKSVLPRERELELENFSPHPMGYPSPAVMRFF